jgi:hypothetical protein
MSDRSKKVGHFFDRPSTPPSWPSFGQTPETDLTASLFTITANHAWNDINRSSNEKQLSEKVIRHNLNSSLTALSASPDRNHVVVAGREGSNKVFL